MASIGGWPALARPARALTRAGDKDPASMPVLVEQFVVVGDQNEAIDFSGNSVLPKIRTQS